MSNDWPTRQEVGVTGGRGALGRRLVRRLCELGARRIVAFDRAPITSEAKSEQIEQVQGDILESADLERAFPRCPTVFHLAALIHSGRSQQQPALYFEVNTLGTNRVVDACYRLGTEQMIYTSTCHVYGKPEVLPVPESHPTVPRSIYAASKLAGEQVLAGYAASFDLGGSVARLANMYGGTFSTDTVVGSALEQINAGRPLTFQNLKVIRDFIHIDDVVEALIHMARAAQSKRGYCIYNVGSGTGCSVARIAAVLNEIASQVGLGPQEIRQSGLSREEPIPEFTLDCSRLRQETGWRPQLDLEQGLKRALVELSRQVPAHS